MIKVDSYQSPIKKQSSKDVQEEVKSENFQANAEFLNTVSRQKRSPKIGVNASNQDIAELV